MEFEELLIKRRSVRSYEDQKPDTELLKKLIEKAGYAPSWKNSQPCRYHCINSDKADEIGRSVLPEFNQSNSKGAALVVCTYEKGLSGFQNTGEAANEAGDSWGFYDLGLNNAYFILAAADMGLSTLIMGIRDAEKIRKILEIPKNEVIVSVIAVGYGTKAGIFKARKNVEEIAKFY